MTQSLGQAKLRLRYWLSWTIEWYLIDFMRVPIEECEIIAPNFKKRLSGVTSTIIGLIDLQHKKGVKIATLSPKGALPEHLPAVSWWGLIKLWQKPNHQCGRQCNFRIWHARRNIEMFAGIILRDILRMKLRLIFTSAAQRHHRKFTRFLIRRMDRVIATSVRSGSFLQVAHQVIMHGIDLERFHPAIEKDDDFSLSDLEQFRKSENRFSDKNCGKNKNLEQFVGGLSETKTALGDIYAVGCFGRLRAQKGTDLFVGAMIELLPHYPQWIALISGRTTPEHQAFVDNLKQKIVSAGLEKRILFLGEVSDIAKWYRRLTLYVAPSRNEGFGLTPLEAMASQTAVVASDAGAYPELVGENCGTVVAAGDGQALTRAIGNFMADPQKAKQAGKCGATHVNAHFPLAKEADAIAAIYDELLRT